MTDRYLDQPGVSVGARVTELRVHGVGGAPPEEILFDPHPVRVSGDRHSGFYRPGTEGPMTERCGGALPGRRYPLEAYSWGGLTSGDWFRALWLLVLPFAVLNVAGWMHHPRRAGDPAGSDERTEAPIFKMVMRLFALSFTVMLVAQWAALGIDVVAYQCGFRIGADCTDAHWWAAAFEWTVLGDHVGRFLVLGAVAPFAALLVVWLAVLPGYRRLETVRPPVDATNHRADVGLTHGDFWAGERPVRRLRWMHLAAGFAALAIILAAAAGDGLAGGSTAQIVLVVVGVVFLVVLAAGVAWPASQKASESFLDQTVVRVGVVLAAFGTLLAVGVLAWLGPESARRGGGPSNLEQPLTLWLVVGQAALWVLIVLALLVRISSRGRGAGFFRLGPAVAALLGWLMVASFWAGTALRLVDFLGCGVPEGNVLFCPDGQLPFAYPLWYEHVAVVFFGVLAALMVVAGVLLVRIRGRKADVDRVVSDYGLQPPLVGDDRRRAHAVAKAFGHSRIVAVADRWLTVVLAGALVAGVALGLVQRYTDLRYDGWLVTLAGWAVAAVPVLAVLATRAAVTNPAARRGVAGVFDALTFFPRRFHPFAPPCYGERAVPQLVWRIGLLTGGGRSEAAVVRAHSQGTVVTVAALLQPRPSGRPERTALFTYGSPLRILHRRMFPAYFGGGLAALVADQIAVGTPPAGRWQHLHADTDLLGVPIADAESAAVVQTRILDPPTWSVQPGEAPPAMGRHSVYHRHPAVAAAVCASIRALDHSL